MDSSTQTHFFDDMSGKEFLKFVTDYRKLGKDNRILEMLDRFEFNPKGKAPHCWQCRIILTEETGKVLLIPAGTIKTIKVSTAYT